ncbi:ATP-binding protein [Pseudarthrobacter defluvii]|uniref:ATP-binding protein n=1 Tax=Pseudarthrobacter defluvii TaxID=410837 RepID=UPI00257678E9|nr:ATP-binding protein [Pseudarthrobacter defluvii]WJH26652.1 HAMP domain-containing protein [Pseudarthrobacter defluvii]
MDTDRVLPSAGGARWGVRKRATATAVLVVAAALAVGGLVLLVLLQTSLVASTETAARRQAADVIAQISGQDVAEAGQYIVSTAHTGQYVQILTPGGAVFAASVPAAKTVALTSLRPGHGQTLTQDVSGLPSLRDDDDFLIVATGADVGGRLYTVVVAATVQVQADTVSTVAWFILGATPLLLVVVGVSVWVLVGRSLRQVERIRGQVAGISARNLDGRVDVPPTSDEIQALAETMNMMLGRLQASDQEQRRFVSDASHELRSPLATLSAGVEIAAADASGATWEHMKTVLAGETARMRYLVEDLLTLAKTNDGGLRLETTDVDLDDVLNEEVRRLRSTSTRRIEASLEPSRITGDPRRLGQVIRNVLDNADRHAASRIGITLRNTGSGAQITIDNDGPPVPAADRERIFERFVRLDQSRSRESGGSGLGLAIAAGIMTAHHGWIRTGETLGGGCRFELGFAPAPEPRQPKDPVTAGDPRAPDTP